MYCFFCDITNPHKATQARFYTKQWPLTGFSHMVESMMTFPFQLSHVKDNIRPGLKKFYCCLFLVLSQL